MPIEAEEPAMRKAFTMALAATLSAILAGCGEGDPEDRQAEKQYMPDDHKLNGWADPELA
jgi:hypothetical protein